MRLSIQQFLILFITGIAIGTLAIVVLAYLPFPPENAVYRILGIQKPRIVGFLPFWLLDKAQGPYRQSVTNLTYFGLTLDTDGSLVKLISSREEDPGWTALRSKSLATKFGILNSGLATRSLLVHSSDEASISGLLTDPVAHGKTLVNEVAPIMKKYGYTELNLDLESFQDATPGASMEYSQFVQAVRNGLVQQKLGLLTVDLPVRALFKPLREDPVALGKIADYIVLMAYDYSYLGSYVAGPVAPIGGAPKKRELDVGTALAQAVKQIPRQKILLGIPLYGYEWETISPSVGSPVIPLGGSTASNRRVVDMLKTCTNCTKIIDSDTKEPVVVFPEYAYFNQIYYEDSQSLQEKLVLVKKYDLGGVALWALGYEGADMLSPLVGYKNSFRIVR